MSLTITGNLEQLTGSSETAQVKCDLVVPQGVTPYVSGPSGQFVVNPTVRSTAATTFSFALISPDSITPTGLLHRFTFYDHTGKSTFCAYYNLTGLSGTVNLASQTPVVPSNTISVPGVELQSNKNIPGGYLGMSTIAPGNGNGLVWVASAGEYQPTNSPLVFSGNATALQGYAISGTAPTANDLLAWTGSTWAPLGTGTVYADQYATAGFTSKGCGHCGQATSGSNIVNITTGTMTMSSSDIGKNVYVSGAFGGVYQTITGVNSSTQFTTANNASSTTFLSTIVIWESGQDDQTGIVNALNAGAYNHATVDFGPRVFVFDGQITIPAGVQAITFAGQNNTFFIPKTAGQNGGCFYQPNAPSGFTLGGSPNTGATLLGGGFKTFAICSAATLSGNTLTGTVTNSVTLPTSTQIRLCGARATGSPLNDTLWNVVTSSSTGFTATPMFWDDTTAWNNITNVLIDGSNNTTLTIGAHNWEKGYTFVPEGCTTVSALNGVTMTVTAITATTVTATGLTHSAVSSTAETGTITHFANQTWTDNFDAVVQYNGIRVISHSNPGQTIAHHLCIVGMTLSGFAGDQFSLQSPNYGYFDMNTGGNGFGGCYMGTSFPTSGYSTNPSSFTMGKGNEMAGNAYGTYLRNAAGFTLDTVGTSGSGVGLLLYDCPAITVNSPDLEEQAPSSIDPTAWPGYGLEVRGCTGGMCNGGYFSSGTVDTYVVYVWDSSSNFKIGNFRDFVSGSGVHPTTEVFIDHGCPGCDLESVQLITAPTAGLQSGSLINLSQQNVIRSGLYGIYQFGGSSTAVIDIVNCTPSTSGATVHGAPTLQFNGQYWNGSASATDTWSLQPQIATGTNGLSTLLLSHVGSSGGSQFSINSSFVVGGGGDVQQADNAAATSGQNNAAPASHWLGQYWNGSATATDEWTLLTVMGAGSNPTTTMILQKDNTNHSTGLASFHVNTQLLANGSIAATGNSQSIYQFGGTPTGFTIGAFTGVFAQAGHFDISGAAVDSAPAIAADCEASGVSTIGTANYAFYANGTNPSLFLGGVISSTAFITAATPTGTGTELGLGNTTGFGNGSAGTAVTTTTKSTGSGPATPQTVVKYLEIDLGGTKYWMPLFQ